MRSHTLHSTCIHYKWRTFVSDQSIIMATVSGEPCTFWLYLTFQWSDFPKKIYTSHSPACILALIGEILVNIHSLHTHCACITSGMVWMWSGKNYLHFTWWAICLPGFISASIGEIFLKTHTSHYMQIHHKGSKFGCHQSIINGTLLRKQCTSSTVPQLQLKGSCWKFILRTLNTWATNCADLTPIGW